MKAGVIFDMDGVLVASGPAHAASWRALARKHGIEMSEADFNATFGQSSRDIVREFWGDQLSDDEVAEIDSEKELIYRELITGMVPLTIGARELLAELSDAGFTLAIGTSGPPENVKLVLRETGLEDYFAAAVNGFDVTHGKPAPDIYLRAAEQAGLRPEQCVVVEDAPVGLASARAANMRTIALVGTHPAETLRDAQADRVVDRLADITPAMIREL